MKAITVIPALQIEDLSHNFGRLAALSGLNISVHSGQVVCLLGPSGCGKSTALRLAAGLESLQSGRVLIDGKVVADRNRQIPPEQRGVGLVFQDFALFPHLSVLDNVQFGIRGMSRVNRRDCAMEMLERVRLADYAPAFPHTLSGGQQQRVALARALAPAPRVILLDEPYSGLDARLRDEVRDEMLHLLKSSDSATLMVTHDSEEAMFMADRIVAMRDGRAIQTGTPYELYCQPRDSFVAGFFSELNRLDGVARGNGVETSIGMVAIPGLADGLEVDVVIRPEGLRFGPARGASSERLASVVQSRLLGRTSLVHLSFPWPAPEDGPLLHMHSRVPGVNLPEPGQVVAIELDLLQTFAFPAADAVR